MNVFFSNNGLGLIFFVLLFFLCSSCSRVKERSTIVRGEISSVWFDGLFPLKKVGESIDEYFGLDQRLKTRGWVFMTFHNPVINKNRLHGEYEYIFDMGHFYDIVRGKKLDIRIGDFCKVAFEDNKILDFEIIKTTP